MSRSKLAWVFTYIWVVFILSLVAFKAAHAKTLTLNEIGDFLAGATAPLAFLWIIVGYFQQNDELKQNNKSLEYQLKELQNSVKQQKELVEVTREDVELSRAALKRQELTEHRNAQPDFRFSIGSAGGTNELRTQTGNIINRGAKAENIEFLAHGDIEVIPDKVMNLDSESETHIALRYPTTIEDDFSTTIDIKYLDSLGSPQSVVYNVERNQSGFFEIVRNDTSA